MNKPTTKRFGVLLHRADRDGGAYVGFDDSARHTTLDAALEEARLYWDAEAVCLRDSDGDEVMGILETDIETWAVKLIPAREVEEILAEEDQEGEAYERHIREEKSAYYANLF